jgi:hypothetical protein
MALLLGMQPAPGVHGHDAVLVVLTGQGGGGGRRGSRVGESELGAVAARPPGRSKRAWWWVGVEAAVRPQPHQHRHRQVGQVQRQLGGVVAAVKDEQRHRPTGGQRTDLRSAGAVGVVQGMQPAGIHRGRPGVAVKAQLGDPLPGPAGNDRLAGRVAGGVVVVAALRRALGVTTRPGGHVHREHQRVGVGKAACQQVAQPFGVDAPAGERIVDAAPATPTDRLQTQVRQRRERLGAQRASPSSTSASARRVKHACSSVRNPPSRTREGWYRHGRAA